MEKIILAHFVDPRCPEGCAIFPYFPLAIAIKTLALPKAFDASLASRSAEKQMLRDAPPAELAEKLLHHFSAFQVQNAVGMLCILKLDINK